MNAWGSMGLQPIVRPGDDGPPLEDVGRFFDPNRQPVSINGKQYYRVGEDLNQTWQGWDPAAQAYLKTLSPEQRGFIDPTYGGVVPADTYGQLAQIMGPINAGGSLDPIAKAAFGAMVGGMGAFAAGPGFAGFADMGTAIPGMTPGTSLWGHVNSLMSGDAPWGVNPRDALSDAGSWMGEAKEATNIPGAYTSGVAGSFNPAGFAAPAGNLLSSLIGGGSGMSGLSTLGLASSGLTGIGSALAANSAANTAANANNRATDAQLGMFNTINNQQAPYRQAGYNSLGSIMGGLGVGPATGGVSSNQFTHQFGPQDLKTNLAPNYDFMLQQGLGEVRNQMNRTGGQYSGNTLKAINDYTQNYASNAYQNAFNNYNANQTNIFNRLSNIAGLGQTANANVGNAGTAISGNAANTMVGAGNAQAAGTIGVGNALSNAGQNAMGWYALPQLLAYSGGMNG